MRQMEYVMQYVLNTQRSWNATFCVEIQVFMPGAIFFFQLIATIHNTLAFPQLLRTSWNGQKQKNTNGDAKIGRGSSHNQPVRGIALMVEESSAHAWISVEPWVNFFFIGKGFAIAFYVNNSRAGAAGHVSRPFMKFDML